MYKEVFHNRIKQIRKQLEFSQQEVADETGINRTKLSKIETGAQEPTIEDLGKLAQFYNISINWLLGVTIEK